VGVKGKCNTEKGESGARCRGGVLSPFLQPPLRVPAARPANPWWVSDIYSTSNTDIINTSTFPWRWL